MDAKTGYTGLTAADFVCAGVFICQYLCKSGAV
ncbi:hypothetical protein FVEG_16947 [Fusarium verticillioides 7600]|uniref:Uncharacterized protein n=1 Tax=Gibberella moniliformis (strain M3125 / FGSC 7600) TaxID=334819 RepID=W7ML86_GIBM7|nr:hypothetical protein FVEG_16947 [Fusarium verticillioides 7600]EWG52228.1 hypothetical protein FVEG_16947 [Fusarium verticillioides 7600]